MPALKLGMPADVAAALTTLGNEVRSAILRTLVSRGQMTSTEILIALRADEDAPRVTQRSIARHLLAMEEHELVACDTSRAVRQGRTARWTADRARTAALPAFWLDYVMNSQTPTTRR